MGAVQGEGERERERERREYVCVFRKEFAATGHYTYKRSV